MLMKQYYKFEGFGSFGLGSKWCRIGGVVNVSGTLIKTSLNPGGSDDTLYFFTEGSVGFSVQKSIHPVLPFRLW